MHFNNVILNLMESAELAWNNSDLEKFNNYFEDDIIMTMEAVTIGGFYFPAQNIHGKEKAMEWLRKYRHVIPLRYKAEFKNQELSKNMVYNKFFYELKIYVQFNCVISEYGRYKEFHISNYQNTKKTKITSFYIMSNILQYKIKRILHRTASIFFPKKIA